MKSQDIRIYPLKSSSFHVSNLYWEEGLLPETLQIEIDFKITFNRSKFESYQDFLQIVKFFEQSYISHLCRKIKSDKFYFDYCLYSREKKINRILFWWNRTDTDSCRFGYLLNYTAKRDFTSTYFNKNEVVEEANNIISQFDALFFLDLGFLDICQFSNPAGEDLEE